MTKFRALKYIYMVVGHWATPNKVGMLKIMGITLGSAWPKP